MSKKTVWLCIASILLVGYYCFALTVSSRLASTDKITGLDVRLSDPESRFVNIADVIHEAAIDPDTITRLGRRNIDLYALQQRLNASDKLQSAQVNLLANGVVRIAVEPMVPVARVFDHGKPSYYINATGKRISAELRYHIDVPVLVGTFDSIHPAARLLPLLHYIAENPAVSALVATVMQEPDGNIIIAPNIVGHVINFGDTTAVADKFKRLRQFYRHVVPTRGWDAYDTIAVKWAGQVVATRRHKQAPPITLPTLEEQSGIFDIEDDESMAHPETLVNATDSTSVHA